MTITTDDSPDSLKAKIKELIDIIHGRQMMEINIEAPGYETYFKEGEVTLYLRPLWRDVEKDPPKEGQKVLAIVKTETGKLYNFINTEWFMNTIYACYIEFGTYVIESFGPPLPATHWMPLPEGPNG